MSIIDQIAELMLREGDIKGQQARERIAAEEEQRQAKHRVLKNTLKGIALGLITYYTGGAGTGPAAKAMFGNGRTGDILGSVGGMAGGYSGRDAAFLDPSQNPDILVQRRGY